MHIQDLMIEVTRRCNMTCEHCCRGPAQNIDMDLNYVREIFHRIKSVDSLILTGGEPSLVPDIIFKIAEFIEELEVDVFNFYIATNGKIQDSKFIVALAKLWSVCLDNEASGVEISNDFYHDSDVWDLETGRRHNLEVFKFFKKKYKDGEDYTPIKEGRAKTNDFDCYDQFLKEERIIRPSLFILEDELESIRDSIIYLNCKGNIIQGCDWSYKSQDRKKNIICYVNDFSYKKVKEFALKHNLVSEDSEIEETEAKAA